MNSKVTPLILGENPLVGTLDEEVKKVKRDFKNFDKTGQPSETSYRERVNREKQITASKTLTDQRIEKHGKRACNTVPDNYSSASVSFFCSSLSCIYRKIQICLMIDHCLKC